jgi:ribosomal-protein-alanine N-acetyltransferase
MSHDPPPNVDLVLLGDEALQALVAGDLEGADDATGLTLPRAFLADRWLWSMRLGQLIGEPGCAPWLVRAVVARPSDEVVGHAGFHGPPDERGMVEVGYRIVPERRRQGYATAALTELIAFAREHGARTVRASIAPGNAPSRALAAAFDFVATGEQQHERNGHLLVFERDLT